MRIAILPTEEEGSYMGKSIARPVSEIIDAMTINQIKEVRRLQSRSSYTDRLNEIEADLEECFGEGMETCDAELIRLIIALAQMNFHIWRTKEIMQKSSKDFENSMALAHQLNGLRNQLKNRILDKWSGLRTSVGKSNVDTDGLLGWDLSILSGSVLSSDINLEDNSMFLADIVDAMTIYQIKEALFDRDRGVESTRELEGLTRVLDEYMCLKEVRIRARTIRLIIFLAQANLQVWYLKEDMQKDAEHYNALLELAQELNGLRNHARNLLMREYDAVTPADMRTTFLDYTAQRWYAVILSAWGDSVESGIESLVMSDFARLFAISADELEDVERSIVCNKDLRFRRIDSCLRDSVVVSVLKRIYSGDMWVSGPDKKEIWDRGWSENAREYEQSRDLTSLSPKFLQSKKFLRMDNCYIEPIDSNFEFNVIDVYRRWVFRKFLSDADSIWEFGCGSCQHIPVFAELHPEKAIHALDWSDASMSIAEQLIQRTQGNLFKHKFNMFEPDINVGLTEKSAVITIGTMEQMGEGFEPFLKFLLQKSPSVVVHMESIEELYSEDELIDFIALEYDRKRNYLKGYLTRLRELESDGKIEIISAQRVRFGSMYHDSYSLLVWKPR